KEEAKVKSKVWYDTHKWLTGRYELTETKLEAHLAKTHCDLCGEPFTPDNPKCVDHYHKTGEVRGSLCRHCNAGLGQFKDNPETLQKALAYFYTQFERLECLGAEEFYSQAKNKAYKRLRALLLQEQNNKCG